MKRNIEARSVPLATAALALAVVLGIAFRCYDIDRKVFWDDETYTALRIVGLTESEAVARVATLKTVAGVQTLLHPARSQRRPASATVSSLVREDPQHPPLYYLLAYLWTLLFGTSIVGIRSVSVAFGLAAMPLMYWLCFELFDSRRAAWTGTALIAVSPIFVLFSQESREYMLWIDTTLWMSAALLRAIRLRTAGAWSHYALGFAAGLYTYPLTLLVGLGHAIYVVAQTRARSVRPAIAFALAGGAAIAAYAPWLALMFRQQRQIRAGLASSAATEFRLLSEIATAFRAVMRAGGQVRLGFFDVDPLRTGAVQAAASAVVIGLVAGSLFSIRGRTPTRPRVFIAALMGTTSLPVLIANFTLPNQPFVPRFYLPFYLTTLLAVTGGIVATAALARAKGRTAAWRLAVAGIFASCVLSSALGERAETWWNKENDDSQSLARGIAASASPVLVSDSRLDYSLVLSYYLPRATAVVLRPRCWLCHARSEPILLNDLPGLAAYRNVYLLGPSQPLRRGAEAIARGGLAVHCIGVNVRLECASDLSVFPAGW